MSLGSYDLNQAALLRSVNVAKLSSCMEPLEVDHLVGSALHQTRGKYCLLKNALLGIENNLNSGSIETFCYAGKMVHIAKSSTFWQCYTHEKLTFQRRALLENELTLRAQKTAFPGVSQH